MENVILEEDAGDKESCQEAIRRALAAAWKATKAIFLGMVIVAILAASATIAMAAIDAIIAVKEWLETRAFLGNILRLYVFYALIAGGMIGIGLDRVWIQMTSDDKIYEE